MLDGIDVHVIDVMLQIDLVTNPMFPKPPLPYSAFAPRRARSRDGFARATAREKPLLIKDQRPEKSWSSPGNVQIACMCSGSTTQAMISKGWRCLTVLTAVRKSSMRSTSRRDDRSARLTVKK
jgi:hypothetical protein